MKSYTTLGKFHVNPRQSYARTNRISDKLKHGFFIILRAYKKFLIQIC